eukprot:scaffold6937_cov118-Phaeocystis_antarctica.AAC.1
MAIPSLAAMAALTLFRNPHMQPEGVSVDYTPYAAPARAIQRWWRRRNRAATRINALMRAFSVRCFVMGYNKRNWLLHMHDRVDRGQRLTPHLLRGGRRYLVRVSKPQYFVTPYPWW